MSSSFRPDMRNETRKLILDWGKNSVITRFVSVAVAGGRDSGAWITGSTEKLWIQPVGGFSDVKESNLDDQTTHLCFHLWSGYAVEAKDRILASGDTLEFDLIKTNLKESHRFSELKQVRRS